MNTQREDSSRPSDALLQSLIREGLHDAEIAVRLGITTGELRERKAELQRRTGTIGAGPAPRRRLRGWRLWFALAAAGAAAVLAVLLVIANIAAPGTGDAGADVAATEAARGARQTQVAATPTRSAPGVVVVEGVEMDDLGPFLAVTGRTPDEPVGEIVNRAALIGVRLAGDGFVLDSPVTDWTSVMNVNAPYAWGLRGRAGERTLLVNITAEYVETRFEGTLRRIGEATGALIGISAAPGSSGASILIEVSDESGRPYRSMLTPEGRLLVSREPLGRTTVVDYFTGAALDVGPARPFGILPTAAGGWTFTICNDSGAGACIVSWRQSGQGYAVPAPGILSCPGGRELRYASADFTLTFRRAGSVQGTVEFACEPEPLDPGRAFLPDGNWLISAAKPDGTPVSVTVAGDGTLYIGDVAGVTGCPCRGGS
ncbi:MAG: hypothetical protein FIB00_13430 [Chloroflexi bacterium]|nr:hypothetical protein [Chloroflexota bacterium]PWB48296.1 MAG: hypothetical protein C3F10_00845 [Dehalococcoidia bacterium]